MLRGEGADDHVDGSRREAEHIEDRLADLRPALVVESGLAARAKLTRMYGQPPGYAPSTVKGVPLQPGERVIYFNHNDGSADLAVNIIMGVLLIWIGIGLLFLHSAFFPTPITIAITTHRFIHLRGKNPAKAKSIPHGHVRGLIRTMRRQKLHKIQLDGANNETIVVDVFNDDALAHLVLTVVDNPRLAEMHAPAPNVLP